jgi:hypothetical protein
MSQPSIYKQMQSLREYTKLHNINDMVRSFDSENNLEKIGGQEDNTFDYFLQSAA